MSNVISFDDSRARVFVEDAFNGFLIDPAESDYQRGYLAALEIVGKYARPINEASAADAVDASETALHAQEEGDHRNEPSFLRVAGAATP